MVPTSENSQSSRICALKWFSGLAMQAIISKQQVLPQSQAEREEVAVWAWRMGQAMMAVEKLIHADRDLSGFPGASNHQDS